MSLLLAIDLGRPWLWWLDLANMVGIYALLALSLNLINGYAGMFSLGHHGFWALGAYSAAWLARSMHGDAPGALVYASSAGVAMGTAALGGLLIGLPCLRLRGDYLALATLGFGEIVRIAIQNSDPEVLGGSLGLRLPRVLMQVTSKTKDDFRLLSFAIAAGLCLLMAWSIRNLIRSGLGRRMLAVAQDETAAGLLGINPTRSRLLAFVLGSAGAGLAGAVYAHYQSSITPLDFSFMQTVKILLIIVLGGMGSISGCMLGAVLVVFTEQGLARLDQPIRLLGLVRVVPAEWWQVLFPVLLAVMILLRPQGLFGHREITDLFRRRRGA